MRCHQRPRPRRSHGAPARHAGAACASCWSGAAGPMRWPWKRPSSARACNPPWPSVRRAGWPCSSPPNAGWRSPATLPRASRARSSVTAGPARSRSPSWCAPCCHCAGPPALRCHRRAVPSPSVTPGGGAPRAVAAECALIASLRGTLLEKTRGIRRGRGRRRRLRPSRSPPPAFRALPPLGSEARLFIHTHAVKDGWVHLFGFADPEERRAFEALLSVQGVGPRVAVAILSGLALPELVRFHQQRLTSSGWTQIRCGRPQDLAERLTGGTARQDRRDRGDRSDDRGPGGGGGSLRDASARCTPRSVRSATSRPRSSRSCRRWSASRPAPELVKAGARRSEEEVAGDGAQATRRRRFLPRFRFPPERLVSGLCPAPTTTSLGEYGRARSRSSWASAR